MKDTICILFILMFGLCLFIYNNEPSKNILKKKRIKKKSIEPIIDISNNNALLDYKLKNRDRKVVEDTLVAPEKRVEKHQYTTLKLYENTRGDPDDYHLLGVMYNETANRTYQLFGRRTYPGSPLFEYYYRGRDSGGLDFKFPLSRNNEIYDGDTIILPTDNIEFKVKIYPNDIPRYNPFI